MDNQIAALSTAQAGVPITSVMVNLGVNDLASMPSQVQYEADLGYIADAFRARWSLVHVYFMSIWVRGGAYAADLDILAGWNANVIAARPGWAHVGPDERVWLEGGDDGVTMTTDGVHYTTAGHNECAAQWKTVLGY